MAADNFMKAEDVARYLHIGKNMVYQLAKEGKLASYHVGRKIKFTPEDVDKYLASTHIANSGSTARHVAEPSSNVEDTDAGATPSVDSPVSEESSLSSAASFGVPSGPRYVIAGNDVSADMLSGLLLEEGLCSERLVRASYTALVNLYAGDADAAVVHLYDQRSNSYNVSSVRSLAPGASVVVIRMYARSVGFIVKKGNPKRITSWGALLREGVRIANRAKGSGARVLLDEKLSALEARSDNILGYESVVASATGAMRRIASGLADVAVGTQHDAMLVDGVEFVPMQTEWVDIVVAKNPHTRPLIKALSKVMAEGKLSGELKGFQPCDVAKLGAIVYES